MSLNNLPVVVDAPGYYRTRGGLLVRVWEIAKPSAVATLLNEGCVNFRVKGNYIKEYKSGRRLGAFEIWHVSGRLSVFRENQNDIVTKT